MLPADPGWAIYKYFATSSKGSLIWRKALIRALTVIFAIYRTVIVDKRFHVNFLRRSRILDQLTSWALSRSLQSRRILERDPWIVFRNNVVPPSWTLILPESWDESKTDFKGEVDGFKIGEGEGNSSPFHRPSPLVFFVAFQDGSHDQCTSEFSLQTPALQAICPVNCRLSHK